MSGKVQGKARQDGISLGKFREKHCLYIYINKYICTYLPANHTYDILSKIVLIQNNITTFSICLFSGWRLRLVLSS